eukprot:153250-Chlamydomonas_euryale.AAC.1
MSPVYGVTPLTFNPPQPHPFQCRTACRLPPRVVPLLSVTLYVRASDFHVHAAAQSAGAARGGTAQPLYHHPDTTRGRVYREQQPVYRTCQVHARNSHSQRVDGYAARTQAGGSDAPAAVGAPCVQPFCRFQGVKNQVRTRVRCCALGYV